MTYPSVRKDLVNLGPLGGIVVQDLRDQVPRSIRNGDVLREVVGVHANPLVGGLDVGSLEGWLSDNESIKDDTDRPNIYLITVSLLAFKNLWRDIVGSTADGSLALPIKLEFGRQTEISDLDFHLIVEEEVAELQVTMDNSVGV